MSQVYKCSATFIWWAGETAQSIFGARSRGWETVAEPLSPLAFWVHRVASVGDIAPLFDTDNLEDVV